MVVRKTEVANASWRLSSGMSGVNYDQQISPQKMSALLAKAKTDERLGQTGADALKLAYRQARTKAGADPTRGQVAEQVSKAIGSLSNERARGRVNDGYVDKHEASLVKGELAAAVYKFLDVGPGNRAAPTSASDLAKRASATKIDQAVRTLLPIVDKGFKAYDPDKDDNGEGPGDALRKAANDAGLSSAGRAAILTALNGATSRGDGDGYPEAADVKRLLTNAQSKLKDADGAKIVDFKHSERAATTRKDGVTTGLELDRTPAATGMTSRALLAFAATL